MGQRVQRRQVSRLPAERRISDIMKAAREIFTEKGFTESLISDIAERAGVVEGTIYRFFSNKRDLLQRVAEGWFHEMMDHSAEGYAAIRGEWNRLHFVLFYQLDAILREPGLPRLVMRELQPDPGYRNSQVFALSQEYSGRVVEIVREGMARGIFRADASPELVRDMAFGAIEQRTWAFLQGGGEFDPARIAREITDQLYAGLLAQPAAPDSREHALLRLERIAERLEQALSA